MYGPACVPWTGTAMWADHTSWMSLANLCTEKKFVFLSKFPFIHFDFPTQVDRSGKNRVVVPVLVPKDTSWQDRILDFCVLSLESGDIPSPQVDSMHAIGIHFYIIL